MSTDENTRMTNIGLWRRAHVGAAKRAAAIWEVLTALRACTVELPYDRTMRYLASAIYNNASYDACLNYEDAEDFEEALREDKNEDLAVRKDVDGVDTIVMSPFFSEKIIGSLHHMKLTYLGGYCRLDELSALNCVVPDVANDVPWNVSTTELEVLTKYHRSACIALVNAMRHLRTALCYVKTGLRNVAEDKYKSLPELTLDKRAAGLVEELIALADLPFTPTPLTYFGTEADRVNPLRSLPESEDGLKSLLDWA